MARRSDPPRDPTPRDSTAKPRFERWIEPFFHDSSLWPVLGAAAAIFVTIGTAALLLALSERSLPALGALLGMLWLSLDVALRERRRGRFGLASRCIAVYWTLVALSAIAISRFGWF